MSSIKDRVRLVLAGSPVLAGVLTRNWPLHHTTHEDGGIDEIDVTGLSGLLDDPQDAGSFDGTPIDSDGLSNGDVYVYNSTTGTFQLVNVTDITGVASLSSNDNNERLTGHLRFVNGTNIVVDKLDDDTGYQISAIIEDNKAYADSVNLVVGTVDSGDVDSTHTFADGDIYGVNEADATPGLDAQFAFSGVSGISKVSVYLHYDGAGTISVQLYNYTTTTFVEVGSFTISDTWEVYEYPIAIDADYIDGSGNSLLRFTRTTAGNPVSLLQIDYAALVRAVTSAGGVTDHGSLTGLPDESDHPYAFMHNGNRAMTGTFNLGGQRITDTSRSGSTWSANGIRLADTSDQWDDIETLIGSEGSLFAAILAAAEVGATVSGLAESQLLFGASDGTIEQSSGILYDVADSQFVIGGGFPGYSTLGPGVYFAGGLGVASNRLYMTSNCRLDHATRSGSTWTSPNGILFAASATEWSDLRTLIGSEGSLFAAILAASEIGDLTGLTENELLFGSPTGGVNQSMQLKYDMLSGQLTFFGGYTGSTSQGPGIYAGANIGLTGRLYFAQNARLDHPTRSGSTWTDNAGIALAASPTEWSSIETLIGSEGSLFAAILAAAATGGSGGTLDDAYNYGGAGAGAFIGVTDGPVVLQNDGENSIFNLFSLGTSGSIVDPVINLTNNAVNAPSMSFYGSAGEYVGAVPDTEDEYLTGHRLYINNGILSMVCEEDTTNHESHSVVSVKRVEISPDYYETKAQLLSAHEDGANYHYAKVSTVMDCATASTWTPAVVIASSGFISFGQTPVRNCLTFGFGSAPILATWTAGTNTIDVDWTEGDVQYVVATANITTVNFTTPLASQVTKGLSLTVTASGSDVDISGFTNVKWFGTYDPDAATYTILDGSSARISLEYRGSSQGYHATIIPEVVSA